MCSSSNKLVIELSTAKLHFAATNLRMVLSTFKKEQLERNCGPLKESGSGRNFSYEIFTRLEAGKDFGWGITLFLIYTKAIMAKSKNMYPSWKKMNGTFLQGSGWYAFNFSGLTTLLRRLASNLTLNW
ncbi:hypothetical protein PanWU01x14_357680 [Parasponia andersonii]|uniref:Uncharacterized protein n=1 Tax=Parasponia andersonii TaxID=3476 RepID=A0A2P5A8H5_PARAD|nr:hypothetical protein PanWU01x14_357680 [Parasponia andersonii]